MWLPRQHVLGLALVVVLPSFVSSPSSLNKKRSCCVPNIWLLSFVYVAVRVSFDGVLLAGPNFGPAEPLYGFLLRSAGIIKGTRPHKAKNRSLLCRARAVRVLCQRPGEGGRVLGSAAKAERRL